MAEPCRELDEIIRRPALRKLTGLSDATIFRLIQQGRFPRPVELSANARGWRASQVQAWQEALKPVGEPLEADVPSTGEAGALRGHEGSADHRR